MSKIKTDQKLQDLEGETVAVLKEVRSYLCKQGVSADNQDLYKAVNSLIFKHSNRMLHLKLHQKSTV